MKLPDDQTQVVLYARLARQYFFYKSYKHLKRKIKTSKSIKNKFYPHMIRLKKDV